MWEGWSKNLLPLVTWSGQRVTRELFFVIPWISLLFLFLVPFLLAPWDAVLAVVGIGLLAGCGQWPGQAQPAACPSPRQAWRTAGRGMHATAHRRTVRSDC